MLLLDSILELICIQTSVGKISFTSDLWSDPNLTPFIAVTAHWIEPVFEETPTGKKCTLWLRADLVGFIRIPGQHTGEHLAHAFLYITDHLHITEKEFTLSFVLLNILMCSL
jgi:hypothetical protein